jgi:hypothetical protein
MPPKVEARDVLPLVRGIARIRYCSSRILTVTTILPPDRGLSLDVFIIPLAAHVMQLNTPIVLTSNMCV